MTIGGYQTNGSINLFNTQDGLLRETTQFGKMGIQQKKDQKGIDVSGDEIKMLFQRFGLMGVDKFHLKGSESKPIGGTKKG